MNRLAISLCALLTLCASALAAPVVTVTRGSYTIASIKVDGVEVADPHDLWCGYDVLQNSGTRIAGVNIYNSAVSLTATPLASPLVVTHTLSRPTGPLTTVATYTPIAGGLRISVKKTNASAETVTDFVDVLQDLKIGWPTNYNPANVRPDPRGFPVMWLAECLGTTGPPIVVACEDIQPAIQVFANGNNNGNPSLRACAAKGWSGIRPGETFCYTVGIYFDVDSAAAKATYSRIAAARPNTLVSRDRTPIGKLMIASSAKVSQANPHGYFPGVDPLRQRPFVDVLNQYADTAIGQCRIAGAKRLIIWDIEGERTPTCVYYGSPHSLPPEMDAAADAFMARLRAAGIEPGLCIRPIVVGRGRFGDVDQYAEAIDPKADLAWKINYARTRWAVKLYYVDSDNSIDAESYKSLRAQFPDVLLLSEHNATLGHYAHCAAYEEGPKGGTPPLVRKVYPEAFTALNFGVGYSWSAGPTHDSHFAATVAAVKGGDVLLFDAWFGGPAAEVQKIYAQAGTWAPPTGTGGGIR